MAIAWETRPLANVRRHSAPTRQRERKRKRKRESFQFVFTSVNLRCDLSRMTKSWGLFWTSISLSCWVASMMDRQECVILSSHRARNPQCHRRRLIEILCSKEKNWGKMRRVLYTERGSEFVLSDTDLRLVSKATVKHRWGNERASVPFRSCRWKHQYCPLESAVGWSSTALTSLVVVRWSRDSSLLICSYSSKLCYCVRWSMRERSMNNGFAVRQRARRLVNIEINTERRWKMTRFSPLPVRPADRWPWLSISSSPSLSLSLFVCPRLRRCLNWFGTNTAEHRRQIDRSIIRSSL